MTSTVGRNKRSPALAGILALAMLGAGCGESNDQDASVAATPTPVTATAFDTSTVSGALRDLSDYLGVVRDCAASPCAADQAGTVNANLSAAGNELFKLARSDSPCASQAQDAANSVVATRRALERFRENESSQGRLEALVTASDAGAEELQPLVDCLS